MMYGLYDDYQYERSFQIANRLNQLHPDENIRTMLMRSALMTNRFEIAAKYREEVASKIKDLPKMEVEMLKSLSDLSRIGADEQQWRLADEKSELPRVQFRTSVGSFIVELYEDQYPETVGHFVYLVEGGFYTNLVFHRVTKNFLPFSIAQTGLMSLQDVPESEHQAWYAHDIKYTVVDEKPKDGLVRRHLRGVLSLAVKNKDGKSIPNTAGSQFMITLVPTPALDGNQVAFGRVIEGLDVIDRIAPNITISDEDGKETAIDSPQFCTILEARVLRKRDHEYQPNKTQ
jgi:cyclophilin family peptidyl-prolyl cis-trans isomerase